MTVNRTLLHAQAATSNGSTTGPIPSSGRNGTTHGLRGLASSYSGDESPPPDYNVVVHDNRHGFLYFISYLLHSWSDFFILKRRVVVSFLRLFLFHTRLMMHVRCKDYLQKKTMVKRITWKLFHDMPSIMHKILSFVHQRYKNMQVFFYIL